MYAHYGARSATTLRQNTHPHIGGTFSEWFSKNCKLMVLTDKGSLLTKYRPPAKLPGCIEQPPSHTTIGTQHQSKLLPWSDKNELLYVPIVVSELKPLARCARKDPMHRTLYAASMDCRTALAVPFVTDTPPCKCCYRIKALLKIYISQHLSDFRRKIQVLVAAGSSLPREVSHAS